MALLFLGIIDISHTPDPSPSLLGRMSNTGTQWHHCVGGGEWAVISWQGRKFPCTDMAFSNIPPCVRVGWGWASSLLRWPWVVWGISVYFHCRSRCLLPRLTLCWPFILREQHFDEVFHLHPLPYPGCQIYPRTYKIKKKEEPHAWAIPWIFGCLPSLHSPLQKSESFC